MNPLLLPIRTAELDAVRSLFAPGSDVLELGGGTGWQAKHIASWGQNVQSIDVIEGIAEHYPVVLYDGVNIPCADRSIDLIFSSNVLEHVTSRPALFKDMKRVLRQDGYAVHVVPSASWRFWTSLVHYPYQVKRLARLATGSPRGGEPAQQNDSHVAPPASKNALFRKLRNALVAPPHGVDESVLKEMYAYSRWGWRSCFKAQGFEIVREFRAGVLYTGYGIAPFVGMGARRLLSRLFGSSCHVFVVKPR